MHNVSAAPDLLDPDTFAEGPPHAFFDQLRISAPVHGQPDPINGGTVWSLTRFADVRAVSNDLARFTITQGHQFPTPRAYAAKMGTNIMFNDPPYHTRLRSFAAKAFSPSVVSHFEHWIRECCAKIIDTVLQHDRIDMIRMIAAELPGQVIGRILGVPESDQHNLLLWATEIFGRLDPDIGLERAMAAVGTVREYSAELCAMKRRTPAIDMTSELLNAEYDGRRITDPEIFEMVMALILAGFETTHTLIAQGLTLISSDPDVRRQVETAPDGNFKTIVEEMLRYCCPVMHMARTAREATEICGTAISAGDTVLLWYTAANRDPAVYENPHIFNGQRKRPHFAFGAGGPHFCLGNHLARLEVEILFDEMRKHGLRLELDGKAERAKGVFINALRRVPMRVMV